MIPFHKKPRSISSKYFTLQELWRKLPSVASRKDVLYNDEKDVEVEKGYDISKLICNVVQYLH